MPKRELSEAQQKQLELAKLAFEDKKLVFYGGTYTAEAHEPQRRTAHLDQLELATKLRQQLEDACEQAQSSSASAEDVRRLIIEQSSAMNQLASLTEAVQNGYTLHNYEEYNDWSRKELERQSQTHDMADHIIEDQMNRIQYPDVIRPPRIPPLVVAESSQEQQQPSTTNTARRPSREKPYKRNKEVDLSDDSGDDEQDNDDVDEEEDDDDDDDWEEEGKARAKRRRAERSSAVHRELLSRGGKMSSNSMGNNKHGLNIRGHVLAIQQKMQIAKSRKKKRNRDHHRLSSPGGDDYVHGGLKPHKKSRSDRMSLPKSSKISPVNTSDQHKSKRKSLPSRLREETGVVLRAPGTTSAASSSSPKNPPPPSSSRGGYRGSTASPDGPISSSPQLARAPSPPAVRAPLPPPPKRKAPKKPKPPAVIVPKKCHNCKTTQSRYLKCRFVMPTGNRCGKIYCLGCLKKDYDGKSNIDDDPEEWQ